MQPWFQSLLVAGLLLLGWGVLPLRAQVLLDHELPTSMPEDSASPATGRTGWTLTEILRRSAVGHPLVEAAMGRVVVARGNRASAGAFANPLLTYQVENGPFFGAVRPPGTSTETSFFATLPIEGLYQRWPRIRRADEELLAARSELVSTQRTVVLDATRAFYRVALAQASVVAATEIEARLEALAAYNQSRLTEGVAAEGDLIRIQVEVARAATSTALEAVELARARAALLPFLGDATTGRPSLDSLSVSVEDASLAADTLPPLERFVALARDARPDLLAARARAAAANAEISFQRTLLIRQVGLVFGTKRLSGFNTMIAGVTLPLPIFEQNGGGRAVAAGERTSAMAELVWSERLAIADVEAAYRSAEILTRQAARLQNGFMARADESRRITVAAYEEGAASLLQVLDVSRAWADAQVLYYRTLFAQRQSLLELNVAAGLQPDAAMPLPPPGSSMTIPSHSGDSR